MLGRLCTVSTDGDQNDLSAGNSNGMGKGLSDYACHECGGQRYHLVFRVEALSRHVTLSIVCDVCSVRTPLLHDPLAGEKRYARDKQFVTPQS